MSADRLKNDLWQLPVGNPKPGFDPIPLWLADMNFATAPCVIEVIKNVWIIQSLAILLPLQNITKQSRNGKKDSFGVTDLSEQNIGYQNGVLGGVTSALSVLTDREEQSLFTHPFILVFNSVKAKWL